MGRRGITEISANRAGVFLRQRTVVVPDAVGQIAKHCGEGAAVCPFAPVERAPQVMQGVYTRGQEATTEEIGGRSAGRVPVCCPFQDAMSINEEGLLEPVRFVRCQTDAPPDLVE